MVDPGGKKTGRTARTLRDLIGEEAWSDFLVRAVPRQHPAGSLLLRQGESGTHVVAVIGGILKVVRHESRGDVTLLAFRGPGELLGEIAVLDQGVRSASVETLSPCTVAVLGRDEFLRYAAQHDLFRSLTQYALTRLRESDQARGGGEPVRRLAAALVTLADISCPTGSSVELALTRDELAQHLKVSRNTVTASLGELVDHVQVRRKRVVVQDVAELRRIAADELPDRFRM